MPRSPRSFGGHCEVAGCEFLAVLGTRRCQRHPLPVPASTEPDLFSTPVVKALQEGENFYRQKVLGQEPLPGMPRITGPDHVLVRGDDREETLIPNPARQRSAAPDSFRDHPPSAPRSATSHAAATKMGASGKHRTLTERIHDYIKSWGATGRTRAEIARFLPSPDGTQTTGARLSSVCAAVDTLKKQGLVGVNLNHTRVDPETRMSVEVLVDEAHVDRWRGVPRAARVSPMTPTRRPAGE